MFSRSFLYKSEVVNVISLCFELSIGNCKRVAPGGTLTPISLWRYNEAFIKHSPFELANVGKLDKTSPPWIAGFFLGCH